MKHSKSIISAIAAIACASTSSYGASVIITNPSFETGDPSTSSETGWTRGIGGGYENSGNYIGTGDTSVNRYEVLIGRFGNATKNPFWTQDTGHTPTSANTEYTLTVDIGTANSVGSVGRIELYGTTSSTIYATADFAPVATNTWYETSASYVSDGTESETLGIRLKFGSSGSSDRIEFNDVRLDTAVVPEPTTTALLGLGGLALILRRRK